MTVYAETIQGGLAVDGYSLESMGRDDGGLWLGLIESSNRGGRQITKQDCGKAGILWCPQAGRWPPVTLMLGQSSLYR